MKINNPIGLLLILIALAFTTTNGIAAEKSELLFGSVAMDIPAVMHKRLKPLTQYLSKELGRPVSLKLSFPLLCVSEPGLESCPLSFSMDAIVLTIF